jgi:hypothetical protein
MSSTQSKSKQLCGASIGIHMNSFQLKLTRSGRCIAFYIQRGIIRYLFLIVHLLRCIRQEIKNAVIIYVAYEAC